MEGFSGKVIEGNFELEVATLERSRRLLVICTWAPSKTFRLNLSKTELVTQKLRSPPLKLTPPCSPSQ